MTQLVAKRTAIGCEHLLLPAPDTQAVPGVLWGRCDVLFTPAYWASQVWLNAPPCRDRLHHRLGSSLREEAAACLLGGYGNKAEVGLAAFARLRDDGMLAGKTPTETELFERLSAPICVGSRCIHYRFARQKSAYHGKYKHYRIRQLNNQKCLPHLIQI